MKQSKQKKMLLPTQMLVRTSRIWDIFCWTFLWKYSALSRSNVNIKVPENKNKKNEKWASKFAPRLKPNIDCYEIQNHVFISTQGCFYWLQHFSGIFLSEQKNKNGNQGTCALVRPIAKSSRFRDNRFNNCLSFSREPGTFKYNRLPFTN